MSDHNEKLQMENKMGTKPIVPLIISMSLPPVTSMFMQFTYNFVDCMFVSWLSEDALTAVSLAFPITTLLLAISIGLGVGNNALIARALGAKNQELADSIVSHSLILSFVASIALNIVALLIVKPFYAAFTDDPTIYALGLDYTYIVVFMVVGNMVHICIQKNIQATGNMVAPMLFQMAGVILNFILDPILIFGLFGAPKMGVKGAAVATVLGYFFSMALAFYVLIFTKQKVRIQTKGFKLDYSIFRQILVTGFPSLVMNALGAFMVLFANMFLATYSMTAVAFMGAYFKVQQVVVMTVNGLIQGCLPIMAFNYGAKNRDRLMATLKSGLIIGFCMMGFGAVVLWIFPVQALKLFMASDEMISFGVPALKIMSSSFAVSAFGFMFASFFQAIGRVDYSLLINLLRQLLILVPMMWLLSQFIAMDGIWWSYPIAEVSTAVISLVLFFKKAPDTL